MLRSLNARLIVTAALLVAPVAASAQQSPTWELRISSGSLLVPSSQQPQLKNGQLTAVQVSRVLNSHFALTGTFAWARSRDLAAEGAPKLDIFNTDLGLEARSNEWFAQRPVSLMTFVGFGGGARSYNYRSLDVAATSNLAGYASVGGEVGVSRVGVRLEARAYASRFQPMVTDGASDNRGDVVLMGAVRFNRHRTR